MHLMSEMTWRTPASTAAAPGTPPAALAGAAMSEGDRAPPGAVLLEIAWEVCNQVGGIYQVIRSKAPTMVQRWRDRYCLIGPYVEAKAGVEFEERPATGWLRRVVDDLAARGLKVHHGRWLIPGRPTVLLLEHGLPRDRINELKYRIWEHHGIESPGEDALIDGVITFGEAVRMLLGAAWEQWAGRGARGEDDEEGEGGGEGSRERAPAERRVLAHFHEWMAALAIPMIRHEGLPVATVFTTHATTLGRAIAWNDERFYEHLPHLDAAAEAARYNVKTQHGIERAAAHGADVFTTVSFITAEECEHLLGRRPELVLPNGINVERYSVGHEFQTLHAEYKQAIHRFVMGHFFPSYSFDLDRTLYFFTSGRFEPRNKGFDLCIEAMARLNAELRAEDLGVTVVFFVVSQRATRSILPQVLQRRGVLAELREVCEKVTAEVGEQMFRRAAAGERVRLDDLVPEYWALRLRRTMQAMRTWELPPVVTHQLVDEAGDQVLNHIRSVWLVNRPDDPVKIVYHPEFISPVNPLWGIEYEQFVRGCHLGIFPSAYEPWGYTPLECVAMGVPAITSDLAGFGRYVHEVLPDHDQWGLKVLRRRGRSFDAAAADLTQMLVEFCRLRRRDRISLRNDVERHAWEFDWSRLARAYDWAHDLAMAREGAASKK